jgi:hypothetical protein
VVVFGCEMFDGNQTDHSLGLTLQLKDELRELLVERAAASLQGLDRNSTYAADLESDLVAAREAYVGAAVSEIASLRAELTGPQWG